MSGLDFLNVVFPRLQVYLKIAKGQGIQALAMVGFGERLLGLVNVAGSLEWGVGSRE